MRPQTRAGFFAAAILAVCLPAVATAGVTTFAKGRSVTHKSATGSIAAVPDVCRFPAPVAPSFVPVPYPNSAATIGTSATKTKNDGKLTIKGKSKMGRSSGDESGSSGGLKSSIATRSTEFMQWSFDIKLEGKLTIRSLEASQTNQSGSSDDLPTSSNGVVPRSAPAAGNAEPAVTEVSYTNRRGRVVTPTETTLFELANGEFCLVCMKNGKVTAIHRLYERVE